MMTLTRRLVLVVFSVLLCLSYSASNAQTTTLDPNQTYTSNNAVTYQGWVNGVYQSSLTCWAWGDPGYCGPNPIVRPGGSINFSFGTTDLYQLKSVADILPNSGTGLRVNGYNFGFTSKNGNGWDDGRQDYLTAYVRLNDAKGNETFSKIYDLNSRFNWTTFNYSETFASPYASKDLSTVQYGFVGSDNNGWAGPYGPEIYNVNFSLKYSVDPCFNNPTFSSSCPGYIDALMKLLPVAPTSTVDTSTIIADPTATPSATYTLAAPITSAPTTNATSSETAAATTSVAAAAAATSAAPTALNPQPKIGEVQAAGSTKPSSPSMSQLMSLVNAEQSRVQQAEKVVAEQVKDISAAVTSNAEAVASTASSQSIAAAAMSAAQSNNAVVVISSVSNVPGAQLNVGAAVNAMQAFGVPEQLQVSNEAMSTTMFRPAPMSVELTGGSVVESKLSTDIATKDLITPTSAETSTPEQTTGPVVNSKTRDGDVAGGVTIASIATTPVGYQAYSLFPIQDTPFYPTTSIYKNQTTVDNQRVLRMMNTKSDQLHQQLVEQQYNKGN